MSQTPKCPACGRTKRTAELAAQVAATAAGDTEG